MTAPKIVTLNLPHGRCWLWYPDLQILAVSPHLNEAGREAAIDEFLGQSRCYLVGLLTPEAV